MASGVSLQFHDAANLFPLDDECLEELADDIKANGQLVTIELLDGKILDGRRRYMACRMAEVEPLCKSVRVDDPVAHVLSLNLKRRQLTPSQKAMVAARAKQYYVDQAKERQTANLKRGDKRPVPVNLPERATTGDARDAAGKAAGVSGKLVDFGAKVLAHGAPELIQAVDEGRMAVSTAAVYATEPEDEQRRIVTDPRRNRTYTATPGGGEQPDEPNSATEAELPVGVSRGVGVARANEAINCLMRIPKNDRLRKRGFQIVTDWIRRNK